MDFHYAIDNPRSYPKDDPKSHLPAKDFSAPIDLNSQKSENTDDELKNDLGEKEYGELLKLESFINKACSESGKWNGKPHCEKFPDRTLRLKILGANQKSKNTPYYCSGTRPTVHNTIRQKVKDTDREDMLDEFVYRSLEQTFRDNYDPYSNN